MKSPNETRLGYYCGCEFYLTTVAQAIKDQRAASNVNYATDDEALAAFMEEFEAFIIPNLEDQ